MENSSEPIAHVTIPGADNQETIMPDTNVNQVGPPTSSGFGPRESADETRQAQQSLANDATLDVNMNAVVGRSQALSVDALGKGFIAAQERRQAIFDAMAGAMVKG